MNLIVFDCDDTIWKLPYKENDYYMGLPESVTKHEFVYKENIVNLYNEKRKDKENVFVLLTNRTSIVRDEIVERLFNDKGITFNYELFRDDERNKGKRLCELIKNIKCLGKIDLIEFYDDKHKHRKSIRGLRWKYPLIKIRTFNPNDIKANQ